MAATGVSPADLIARAQALRPTLLERQEATERDTRYSHETHAEFVEAGFYRMLIPRMFGGLEVDVETFAKVMIEIARGCPSTGWGLCLASGHALQVGSFFSEQAQADVFGSDGDFRCAAAFAPRDVLTPHRGRLGGGGHVPLRVGRAVLHPPARAVPAARRRGALRPPRRSGRSSTTGATRWGCAARAPTA